MTTYCFDLDGTLCTSTYGEYDKAQPFMDRIRKVNELYDQGHEILIETARGHTTGIDWNETTTNQLLNWGVRYHKLRVGTKFRSDYYIDDKAVEANVFFCR